MKAVARRTAQGRYTHEVEIRGHRLLTDEPVEKGGADAGPTPQELLSASLAGCTAITIEMYAARKGWDIGPVEVQCEYDTPERGARTGFRLILRLPDTCRDEQIERLRTIATRCPVHRILAGEVSFEERIELAPR
jgi:putative redox protein